MTARRHANVASAGQIAALRKLQMQAADRKVRQAGALSSLRQVEVDEAERAMGDAQSRWEDSLSSPELDLPVTQAWRALVGKRQEELARAGQARADAARRHEAAIAEWRDASRREENAQALCDRAMRQLRRCQDEAAENELADRRRPQ